MAPATLILPWFPIIGGRTDEMVINVKPIRTTNPLYTNTFLAPQLVINGNEHKVNIITNPNNPAENNLQTAERNIRTKYCS